MPDNTNVNNNASVVVVGRTAPVPPGQQKSEKSVPVVIASDQSTIPVAEQNKVQSEVALSLLGIPRSEVALGIFADVNTYDVNPTEWAAEPSGFSTVPVGTNTPYDGIPENMNWGLSHVPEESGALVEAPADKTAILTSKRFFRYQPGRVSAATFGVKTTIMDVGSTDENPSDTQDIGSTVYNPAVRKYGIFDNFDGYYWETRNNGQGDNFCVVRRTQSLLFNNPVEFATTGQTEDFGATNPLDIVAPRGNESPDDKKDGNGGSPLGLGYTTGTYPTDHDSTPDGYENVKLGDLCIYRDNLLMSHAAVYDPSLLQDRQDYNLKKTASNELVFDMSATTDTNGIGKSITNAIYDITSGIMTVTTAASHGFAVGKFVYLSGIGMTCKYSYGDNNGGGGLDAADIKTYPDRTHGYSIIGITTGTFTVNVGVSTVPTFFNAEKSASNGAFAAGLSTSQYVSYDKGSNSGPISGLTDQKIYRVDNIDYNKTDEELKIKLKELSVAMGSATYDPGASQTPITGITNSTESGHSLVTPVPFVQPINSNIVHGRNKYNTLKPSGMFPYMYKNSDGSSTEGYVDTTLPSGSTADVKAQIEVLNLYYRNWINQNVKKDFWNVYEYRVPRSRFSGDRLDNTTAELLYSDVTADNRAGSNVADTTTGENTTDTSIWNLEFNKVTMYKVEFSWYGAVGALFLAYVPVGAGEARWVRVHHLRASNQLKGSSLGNATLPITYLVYGGGGGTATRFGYTNDSIKRNKNDNDAYGSPSEHIIKYGASYYIDGGDEGTQSVYSASSGVKQIFGGSAFRETLLGVKPKDFILNSTGTKIQNKKLIIPTNLSVTTDSLSEIKVETCKGCPGFGHVHTPGIGKTDLGRNITVAFDTPSSIVVTGTSFFFKEDEGAKLIAPSIWNAYIDTVSESVGAAGSFTKATLKGYTGTGGVTFGPRNIADGTLVRDAVTGAATTIGLSNYPHAVRLSQKSFYAASDLPLTGSKIEIQFINPRNSDSYGHFADFNIGLTNIEPVTPAVGDALNGFSILGVTTSVLPDSNILFGNYSHRYAAMDENGVESNEVDGSSQPPNKLGIDFRIPNVASPAGGMCSRITYDIQDPQRITEVTLENPEPNGRSGTGIIYRLADHFLLLSMMEDR